MVNVGKYTIHGSYGGFCLFLLTTCFLKDVMWWFLVSRSAKPLRQPKFRTASLQIPGICVRALLQEWWHAHGIWATYNDLKVGHLKWWWNSNGNPQNRVEVLGIIIISRYIQPWWIDNVYFVFCVLDSVQINTIILCLVDVMTLISLCHTPI